MTRNSVGPRFAVALCVCLWIAGQAAAVQVTLNLVQSQSYMLFTGDFLGTESAPANPFYAQDDATFPTPGTVDADPANPSNRPSLTGTITVDVDNLLAPTSIQILSADMDATPTGNWLPQAVPGLEDAPGCNIGLGQTDRCSSVHPAAPPAAADVAIKLVGFECCDTVYGAIRDFAYNLVTEVPDPDGGGPLTATPVIEPVNGAGEFSSLSQHVFYRRGFFDTWFDPFIDDERDRDNITGDGALNQHLYDDDAATITPFPNAPKSTYVVTSTMSGNLITLTIPVEISNDDLGSASQYFDGQFVATFLIPAGSDGDYNEDGTVNGADYVAWRKLPSSFGGDPAGYDAWRQQFGEPGSGLGGSGAVPEPAGAALVLVGLVALLLGRGRPCRLIGGNH